MATMTVSLSPDYEAFVRQLVESRRYADPSDVVLHALTLLEDQEVLRAHRIAGLQAKIEEGLEDVRAGRTVPADDAFRNLYGEIESRRRQQDAAE